MYACKMMIIMRRDLKMRKGKIAAQAGHAAVEAVMRTMARDGLGSRLVATPFGFALMPRRETYLTRWFSQGEAKVCVYVDSEEELLEINEKARAAGFLTALIRDAGLTEFHGEATLTCMAIEPLPADLIDPITGELPLY